MAKQNNPKKTPSITKKVTSTPKRAPSTTKKVTSTTKRAPSTTKRAPSTTKKVPLREAPERKYKSWTIRPPKK